MVLHVWKTTNVAVAVAATIMLARSGAQAAKGDWSAELKLRYIVNSCAPSVEMQNVDPDDATAYCTCVIDAQEVEFGNAEYEAMMASPPDQDGSEIARRLYRTFAGCAHLIPE